MKRWFSRDTILTRVGGGMIGLLILFGVGASMRHSVQHSTEVQQQKVASKSTATEPVDLSEKPKISVTETKVETSEEDIPFTVTQTYDGTLPKDTEVVRVEGVNGKKVVKTEVKTKDGVVLSRELISETVTVPPVAKVVALGTKVVAKSKLNTNAGCDIHYAPCVKTSGGDVDCKEIGRQVRVVTIGDDPFNLDRDSDGIGCENYPTQ